MSGFYQWFVFKFKSFTTRSTASLLGEFDASVSLLGEFDTTLSLLGEFDAAVSLLGEM